MSDTAALRVTPLNAVHRQSGAKMVDFGGWDMPVQYSGIIDEHNTVRNAVGLFDVSHMGEIVIEGAQALDLVEFISSNWAAKLKIGQAHYSGLLYDHGGFVDDILVHKVAEDHYFICVNAGNQDKDFEHILSLSQGFDAKVSNQGDQYAQIAIQGPKGLATLQKLTDTDLSSIRYYYFLDGVVSGTQARIARTGYTGEDGFEIYIAPSEAPRIWQELLDAGAEFGIKPCGLGARNTLRLESRMALYGHELDASISPLEADLAWIVKFDKPNDFVGRAALLQQKEAGIKRKIVGFEMIGRGIGRDGYEVLVNGVPCGWVTSGGPSPTLGKNIGICMLPVADAVPGRKIEILIRNQPVEAMTVVTPFYKREK